MIFGKCDGEVLLTLRSGWDYVDGGELDVGSDGYAFVPHEVVTGNEKYNKIGNEATA